MSTINITGTGGRIEGNLDSTNVNVNLDQCNSFSETGYKMNSTSYFTSNFDDVTIMFWATRDDLTDTTSDRLFTANGGNDLRIYLQSDVLRFRHTFADDSVSEACQFNLTNEINNNDWFHIAAVYDGSGGIDKLFLNGVQKASVSVSQNLKALSSATDAWSIARRVSTTAESYAGKIADCKIYSTALSEAEIKIAASKINKDPTLISSTAPVGYWPIVGTTIDITDNSSNSNNMTALGTPTVTYDKFSVDVYDNSTTTDGTFTVTQGKVEGLALTSYDFSAAALNVAYDTHGFASGHDFAAQSITMAAWIKPEANGAMGIVGFAGLNGSGGKSIALGLDEDRDDALSLAVTFVDNNSSYGNPQNVGVNASATLSQNQWHHVAVTYTGGGATTLGNFNFYIDGVLFETGKATGTTSIYNHSPSFMGNSVVVGKCGGDPVNGKVRDVRTYDYVLSGEQIASLYSNTSLATPNKLWYKFDATSGVTDESTANIGAANATFLPDANYVNGTLDLDDDLFIGTAGDSPVKGFLSAPRGVLNCAGFFRDNGTFTHNSGEVIMSGAGQDIDGNSTTTFFNLTSENFVDITKSINVEKKLKATGGNSWRFVNNQTITMGTATSAGEIETGTATGKGLRFTNLNKTFKFEAANPELFPWVGTDGGAGWNVTETGNTIELKGCDMQFGFNTQGSGGDEAVTWKLTGDCEFDAVTVSSGDTLNLNGQRAVVSGVLSGSGAMNANNSTLIFTATSGTVFDGGEGPDLSVTDSTDCTFICDAGSGSQVWKNRFQSSDATIFVKSGTLSLSYWNWEDITNFFVGGTFNNSSANRNVTTDNLTIPTGGTLSAGSGTFTCAGDLTASGGLVGNSAMVVSGDNDYEGMVVTELQAQSDWNFSGSEGLTIEGWFKFDDLDFGEAGSNDAILVGHVRSGDTTGKRYGCGLQIMDDKVMAIASNNDTAHTMFDNCSFPVTDMTAGKWHHLAMTVDANDSATPVVKLYLDGKLKRQATGVTTVYFGYNWVVGGYANNEDSQNWTGRRMDGCIARCSAFRQEMTAAQIRSMMFTDYTEMAALSSGVDEAKAVGWWQFDEGTGTAVDNKGTAGDYGNADGVIASVGTTWAGAGTIGYTGDNTGFTLVMAKSGTQTINIIGGGFIDNLTINDGSTTEVFTINDAGSTINVAGNLIVNEKIKSHASSASNKVTLWNAHTITIGSDVKTTALADMHQIKINNPSGTMSIPECTMKTCVIARSGGTTQATGNLTFTSELEVKAGTTFNANGNTITSKLVDIIGTGTFTLGASALVLNDTSGGFTSDSTSTFTAGPGCTVGGDASGQKVPFESQNGFQIVGDVDDLNVTNEELTVVGTVTNCTGEILQFTPGHDTTLSLETDTAEDRDIRLGGPSLDNANHLIAE